MTSSYNTLFSEFTQFYENLISIQKTLYFDLFCSLLHYLKKKKYLQTNSPTKVIMDSTRLCFLMKFVCFYQFANQIKLEIRNTYACLAEKTFILRFIHWSRLSVIFFFSWFSCDMKIEISSTIATAFNYMNQLTPFLLIKFWF